MNGIRLKASSMGVLAGALDKCFDRELLVWFTQVASSTTPGNVPFGLPAFSRRSVCRSASDLDLAIGYTCRSVGRSVESFSFVNKLNGWLGWWLNDSFTATRSSFSVCLSYLLVCLSVVSTCLSVCRIY
eukprot:Selendium_serpulae@DN4229_c1_g1_i1.p1